MLFSAFSECDFSYNKSTTFLQHGEVVSHLISIGYGLYGFGLFLQHGCMNLLRFRVEKRHNLVTVVSEKDWCLMIVSDLRRLRCQSR